MRPRPASARLTARNTRLSLTQVLLASAAVLAAKGSQRGAGRMTTCLVMAMLPFSSATSPSPPPPSPPPPSPPPSPPPPSPPPPSPP
eukprot:scaffold6563_cov70-Phaeocystis_antarctica.AAC.1